MAKRAAICIGVNQAGSMTPLQAAVKGAHDFSEWATGQGCDTTVLVDEKDSRVSVTDIFDAVEKYVKARNCEQLIVYFAGHGILSAPGVEYWLLSRAPENPNEAVNLSRSIEDARNCGIPHVIFVSDACRSAVNGPPLSAVSGATIFPNLGPGAARGEIDIFYATRPGDPAWELPLAKAAGAYRGVFTEFLLDSVKMPAADLVEQTPGPPPLDVITSRKLKPLLESSVPARAAEINVRVRQTPEVQVGTALPQYFAAIAAGSIQHGLNALSPAARAVPTLATALRALRTETFEPAPAPGPPRDISLAARIGLTADVERLRTAHGRAKFETHTGFSLHGARPVDAISPGWRVDPAFEEGVARHWRFHPQPGKLGPSAVLIFETSAGRRGIALAVMPEFIGSVVVDEAGRVISVNYVPSENSWRYDDYRRRAREIEEMKAFAAVASRNGRLEPPAEDAAGFADRIRHNKGLDPTLGLYAAYAYAQAGRYEDAHSVFRYMRDDDPALPVPFDVAMLATRFDPACAAGRLIGPFAPMLSQGWALLAARDPLFQPIHQELRPHLVPSLWTTFTAEGLAIAARFLKQEKNR